MTIVGDGLKANNASWKFGRKIAENFDAHASRSIPLYSEGHELIANLSDFFVSSNSVCYEIGCATGTLTYKLASHNSDKTGSRFIGIDIEKEMIQKRHGVKSLHIAYNLQLPISQDSTVVFK